MDNNPSDLKSRTKSLALRIIRVVGSLPPSEAARIIGKQLLRSGMSVGANYREGCRSRSTAEFASILHISLRECDETAYWLELLCEAEIVASHLLAPLMNEVNEIIAMLVSSINTAKRNAKASKD